MPVLSLAGSVARGYGTHPLFSYRQSGRFPPVENCVSGI